MLDFITALDYKTCDFIIGLSIAACCSLLSTYIVLRRMALISEGVAHAGFGGFGVALMLGVVFPGAYSGLGERLITGAFCLATALAIGYFTRSKRVHDDSAIGIFLVASVALGQLLIKIRVKYFNTPGLSIPSTEQLLFGDFVAVNWLDAVLAVATAVICIVLIASLFHEFLYTTLDEEMARVNGVPTRAINTLLLFLISLVIVVGVRMVGFLMITAMTIIPGATAAMISRRFGGVMAASVAVGVGGMLISLLLAFNTKLSNFPPGPILVLVLFLIFGVTWTIRQVFRAKPIELPDTGTPAPHDHAHSHSH